MLAIVAGGVWSGCGGSNDSSESTAKAQTEIEEGAKKAEKGIEEAKEQAEKYLK